MPVVNVREWFGWSMLSHQNFILPVSVHNIQTVFDHKLAALEGILTTYMYMYVYLSQVIHLVRPLRCAAWCCFCCLQEMEVQSPPGTTVGWIKQDCTFIYPWFSIQNADGETVLKIKGPCWTCRWCDIEFQVRESSCSGFACSMAHDIYIQSCVCFNLVEVQASVALM